jgi:hypothetical protein
MFTAEQYRTKCERGLLVSNALNSAALNETREFRDLEQTYTTLAENEEWMAANVDKAIQWRKNYDNRLPLLRKKSKF